LPDVKAMPCHVCQRLWPVLKRPLRGVPDHQISAHRLSSYNRRCSSVSQSSSPMIAPRLWSVRHCSSSRIVLAICSRRSMVPPLAEICFHFCIINPFTEYNPKPGPATCQQHQSAMSLVFSYARPSLVLTLEVSRYSPTRASSRASTLTRSRSFVPLGWRKAER